MDASFGTGGIVVHDWTTEDNRVFFGAIALQSDGKIVCSGIVQPNSASGDTFGVVVRLDAAGAPDAGAPDGGIVLAGRYAAGSYARWFFARFLD